MEPYVYEPLQYGEIRLFRMDGSGFSDSPITGTLWKTSIPQHDVVMPYTALSYAWGSTCEDGSHLTDYVVCDDRRLGVTSNLKQALLRIRALVPLRPDLQSLSEEDSATHGPYKVCILWIDAMCINQDDVEERGQQVRMMAKIYSSSLNLLIWLGELAPDRLGELQCDLLEGTQTSSAKTKAPSGKIAKFLSKFATIEPPAMGPIPMEVAESILARSWFRRRWVLQETHHARSDRTSIIMGKAMCSKRHLMHILHKYGLLNRAPPLLPIKSYPQPHIFDLLYRYGESECYDPRDRLFALISLTGKFGRELLDVDYNQDARDTYLRLVKRIALGVTREMEFEQTYLRTSTSSFHSKTDVTQDTRILQVLALASCKKGLGSETSMESWVPDWRIKSQFESDSHEVGVRFSVVYEWWFMLETLLQSSITWKLDIANNGYHYLHITGTLLKPPCPTTSQDRYNVRRDKRLWEESALERLLMDSDKRWPQPSQASDRVWISKMCGGIEFCDESCLTLRCLAFVLRTGQKAATFREKQVYFLHSCFRFVEKSKTNIAASTSSSWRGGMEAVNQTLAAYGALIDEEFYLE